MDNTNEERARKAEKIVDLYSERSYRQEDIAKKLNIPIEIVRKVTKEYGYDHGKEKSASNPNNLNYGQTINPLIDFSKMDYLDNYEF